MVLAMAGQMRPLNSPTVRPAALPRRCCQNVSSARRRSFPGGGRGVCVHECSATIERRASTLPQSPLLQQDILLDRHGHGEALSRRSTPAIPARVECEPVHVEEYRIRANEVGATQEATVISIATLLQEVACNHAARRWGRSLLSFAAHPTMVARNLTWVMTGLRIQMDAYPRWDDVVAIEQWSEYYRRACPRNHWIIRDAATNRLLGKASCSWIMMNMDTRRPARMPAEMQRNIGEYAFTEPRFPGQMLDTQSRLPDFQLPPEIVAPVQVARRSDVDMNEHLNNVTYIAWCLEAVPQQLLASHKLYQVELNFKAECRAGEEVESLGMQLAPSADAESPDRPAAQQLLHSLRRYDAGGAPAEVVRCRTTWK